MQSHNTSYNMFGGFGMSQRAQSFADHTSIRTGHDNRTSNHLKTKQLRLLETREQRGERVRSKRSTHHLTTAHASFHQSALRQQSVLSNTPGIEEMKT